MFFTRHDRFFRGGLKSKLAGLFLLIGLLPFLVIGYYGFQTASRSLTDNMLAANQEASRNMSNTLQNFLDQVPDDLAFLENFHALHRFLQWRVVGEPYKMREWLRDTGRAFYSFLNARDNYSQLQVLDLEGRELLRIAHDAARNSTSMAAPEELVSRKDSDYARAALKLGRREIHVTPLHLDEEKESGTLGQPVIRYAMPIFDQNDAMQGVLVLSLRGSNLLDFLNQEDVEGAQGKAEANGHFLLIDGDGQYLHHPDTAKEWGRQNGHGASLQTDVPQLFAALATDPKGNVFHAGWLFSYQRVYPLAGQPGYWSLIKQVRQDHALRPVHEFRNLFIGMAVGIALLIVLLGGAYAKGIVTPLLQIRDHLQALARGKLLEGGIAYRGRDEIAEIIASSQQLKDSFKGTIAQANAVATGNYYQEVRLLSDEDQLGQSLAHMTRRLREMSEQSAAQDWLKTGQGRLNALMSGEQDLVTLSQKIIRFMTVYLEAAVGVIYLVEGGGQGGTPRLKLTASYAFNQRKRLANTFEVGEGLVGQAALEREIIVLTEVPQDYISIESGLGESTPSTLIVAPFYFEDELKGTLELGSFSTGEYLQQHRTFLESVLPSIGIAVNTADSRMRMQALLEQTQAQSEELQSQTEELQSQTEELQTQQEELRQINEELEGRTLDLERQKNEVRDKNAALEKTQQLIETKAKELEIASKYKSEFLANMSHELRTPLNSMLILAQLMAENKKGNLDEKQVEYARTIRSSGADLLSLINDILDLAKVESGKIQMAPEDYSLKDLAETTDLKFRHVAEDKKLGFTVQVEPGLPETLYTDAQRLRQIVNNLLSNAFKFTSQGRVGLSIRRPQSAQVLEELRLRADKSLEIAVSDTGIGIPQDKLQIIFEAFQQADGTTSRRFGGTGLGLSISRQLSRLLGGDIRVTSREGQGSTFSLYLPVSLPEQPKTGAAPAAQHEMPAPRSSSQEQVESKRAAEIAETTHLTELGEVQDDRQQLHPQDKFILIVEDDRNFSRILMDLAREKGFKCLLAEDGKTGLQLARQYKPNAVILDVGLPKMDGWTVMEHLKDDPDTRHIPVHFMSAADQDLDARRMGAIGYLLKPVNMADLAEAFKKIEGFIERHVKHLLLVTDNPARRHTFLDLVGSEDIETIQVESRAQAIRDLEKLGFDCIILDLDVEQRSGIQFLEQLRLDDRFSRIPVIVYADRETTPEEDKILRQVEEQLTVKAVRTPERLLDETTLFLHQVESALPKEKRNMLRMVHDKEAVLAGKRVLIVDDDMRNTFALTTILEDRDMEVGVAANGKEALAFLDKQPDIDLVLMDIMMPEMDGYEAMCRIRAQERFRKLPMIALTAKAMKGDKAKCIEAGANDYLSKPVDTDKLMSLMRVWLYR